MPEMIQSIARASSIMECIAESNNSISITELSKKVDLHKSTVHRILSTLIELGYVKQNPSNNQYEMTIKMFEIGTSAIKQNDLITLVKPHLEKLRDVSGEAIHLVVPDKTDIVYVDKVESNQTLRMHSVIGRRSPMYCTAVGKAILSYRSEKEVDEFWDKIEPVQHTEHTLTKLSDFKDELSQIRVTGISYDNEEHEKDIRCVGTALIDYSGSVVGAISISGPIHRMTDEHINKLIPELLGVKQIISRELGRF
jgi:DNA-binding IclR family transcriptional regulator